MDDIERGGPPLVVRRAEDGEFEAIRRFYHRLIEEMASQPYRPGWKKGVYPTDAYLRESIAGGELHVALAEGAYAAAMVVNRCCNEGYGQVQWGCGVEEGQVSVIHALGVRPACHGQGIAKAMVRYALDLARVQGRRAVRLDVLAGNLPAEHLYTDLGFRYVDTVQMFYEDTGLTAYKLYEYPL